MKFIKVVLMIKNRIAFHAKAKTKKKKEIASVDFNEVKHPAEFLLRW